MNPSLLIFQTLAECLGWTLIHSLWQGLIVAALLAAVLRLLRHSSAAARHAASIAALALLGAGVVVTACKIKTAPAAKPLPRSAARAAGSAAAPRATATAFDPAAPGPRTPEAAPASATLPAEPAAAAASEPAEMARPWQQRLAPYLPWIAGGWIAGVVLLSLRHTGGWLRVRALRRRGVSTVPENAARIFAQLAERLALRRAVRLLASARAATPMLVGVLKPVVLVPAGVLAGLAPRELEAVLAHELAHIARGDAWANLFQIVVETVLFYHPAVWWIGRQARVEREHAADDLAVQMCADRLTYAGALARLAELAVVPPLALAATGGSLLARIRRIAMPPARPEPADGWAVGALVLAVATVLCLPLAKTTAAETAIHVVPGQSIQTAIDAAPDGAVIHLDAGEWKERIVITKPLTLEGEGWEKTTIRIDPPQPGEMAKAYEEFKPILDAAKSPEEKEQAELERQRRVVRPAILVNSSGPVHLRGLRVHSFSQESNTGSISAETLVVFHRSTGTMNDCAVVGPYMNGIYLTQQSDVEIRHSLVAALWGEGIVVLGASRDNDLPPARLCLSDSEVRNVNHYGVKIGRACDTTLIERCRISGTAWHGIRYDDASPTITGNTIFANARCGIYASGKTHATVRGNLFWKNEMCGVSCAFDGTDAIEGNTFVGNLRSGLEVSVAKPQVARNIFADNPTAVACVGMASRGKTYPAGEPMLTANLFWNNQAAMTAPGGKKPAPDDSLNADPKFRDAAKQDFTLAADSPAKSANIGVAEPIVPAGPWPLLAEEKAIIPVDDTRDYQYWSAPGAPKKSKAAEQTTAKAADDAKAWVADAFQLDDTAKREAAIERIRRAMASTDLNEQRTGITAFGQIGQIEFDKPSFRPMVRELLKSPDAVIRAGAASAFTLTGADPEDLPHIYALADDSAPEVRDGLTGVIVALTKSDLTGKPASDAILKLMAKLPKDARSVAHALWGAKFSPEIEARVLEFCRNIDGFGVGYDFLYGALSTQANKSEASVKRLIEILSYPNDNYSGRAAMGLLSGVDQAQYPLVADAMLRVAEARSDSSTRNQALRAVRMYGSAAQAAPLKALLAKPGVTGDFKKQLEETLAAIAPKKDEGTPTPETSGEIKKIKNESAGAGARPELADAQQKKIYFVAGHGEPEVNGEEIKAFRESVQRQNIGMETLKLGEVESIPGDAAAVIVLGPHADYTGIEIKRLNDFWEKKGRVLVFFNVEYPATRLNQWLASVGIAPRGDHVLKTGTVVSKGEDGNVGLKKDVILTAAADIVPAGREITRALAGRTTQLLGSSESLGIDKAQEQKQKQRFTTILESGAGFWGETEYVRGADKPVIFDATKDRQGPLAMAVAVEKGALADPSAKAETSRMVVFGNADFPIRKGLEVSGETGLDLVLDSIDWLLNRDPTLGGIPKERASR